MLFGVFQVAAKNSKGLPSHSSKNKKNRAPLVSGVIGPINQFVNYGMAGQPLTGTPPTGGNGVYTYHWQLCTDELNWTPIANTASLTYQPGTQTFKIFYRLASTSDGVTVFSNTATIDIAPLASGSIGPLSQTINYNTLPSMLTGTPATGGASGTYSYKWQLCIDELNWTPISTSSGLTYLPGTQTFKIFYRMASTNAGVTVFSNSAVVNVYPQLIAGSISPTSSAINYNTSPGPRTGTAATGGNGTYSYQWQSSINGGSSWSNISGGTALSYTPGNLTQSTIYRRQVNSNGAIVYTNSSAVTVYGALAGGSVTPASKSINSGTSPGGLTLTGVTGGNGTYSYLWQNSTNGGSTWNDISTATTTSYTPGNLTQNTAYRVRIISNGITAYSNLSTITIYPQLVSGTVSPASLAINYNTAPGSINATGATGGSGTYTYQWQSSINGGTNWNNISGATALSYIPGNLTQSILYRLQTTSNGAIVYSNSSTITVYPSATAGSVTPASKSINYGTSPGILTGTAATGGNGVYIYQWQNSVNGGTSWVSISAATGLNYTPGNLTQNTVYRRQVTSNGVVTYSNLSTITVYPKLVAGTVSPSSVTINIGASPGTLTSTAGTGGNGTYSYQWQSSIDGGASWSPISGASALTYAPGNLTQSAAYRVLVTSNGISTATNTSVINLNCIVLGSLPSQNQNYIVSSTVKQPGVTNVSQLTGLTVCNLNQTIQYFDGLGRPLQTVIVKGSPGLKDIVQPMAYDAFGREATKYLPYADAGTANGTYKANALTAGAGVLNFYNPAGSSGPQQTNGIVRTVYPFSKMLFEPSPLNRTLEQGAPDLVWQPGTRTSTSGRSVITEYKINNSLTTYTTMGFAVRLYTATPLAVTNREHERTLGGTGYYSAGQLSLTVIKDENWTGLPATDVKLGTSEEYMDKDGRVVLKRVFVKDAAGIIQVLSTHYVYDELGNLSFVLPPGANPNATTVPTQATLDNFCYQYRYDGRKRLIEKKIPGKGWEYIVYNKSDQIVATQDAIQRAKAPQEWVFNKYDPFGRIVQNGLYVYPASTANTAYRINLQDSINLKTKFSEDRISTGIGYTNLSWPTGSVTGTFTLNYYDNYTNIPGLPAITPYNLASSYSSKTKTLLTVSKISVLGTADKLWSVNYYDEDARVVRTIEQHYKGSTTSDTNYDDIINTYNFPGELVKTSRRHFVAGTEQLNISNRYSYDHLGRATDTYQKTGDNAGTTNLEILLSRKSYNEIGQLKTKQLHSSNLITPSFAQTITYSYNPRGWLKSAEAPLFTESLKYEDIITGVTSQYNGNISRQEWGPLATPSLHSANYYYDQTGRLTLAKSDENNNEFITYDAMGNIASLQRKTSNVLTDQLKYNYSGNRLASVIDTNTVNTSATFQLPGTTSYTFDLNGNLLTRTNTLTTNNLSAISYNHLNLPKTLTAGTTSVAYIYDASGRKLSKQVSALSINNEYISGIQYEGGMLKSVNSAEGRVVRNSATSYSYEYVLSDHLGNGRIYFDIAAGSARKIQEVDYYAFGLDLQRSLVGTENKYKYNGKEKQDQEKMYDYGARLYDPVIGRWNAVDNKAEKYNQFSPYTYAINNPLAYIDTDGQDIIVAFTGGPTGGGKTVSPNSQDAGSTGKVIRDAQKFADDNGVELHARVITPGWTSGSSIDNAMGFIKKNYTKGQKVIIYGYSYGGDFAVELSEELKKDGIEVNLLVTVDASDGPAQNSTVDTAVPDNVKENLNLYQTSDSGKSSGSHKSGRSSRSDSNNSGTSNSPGSNGGPNKAKDSKKTKVNNVNKSGKGVNHGNIPDKVNEEVKKKIQQILGTQ